VVSRATGWDLAAGADGLQLAYLLNHPKGYIDAVYSSTDMLLWPVDKVITSIDWSGSFTFVDKARLLEDLDISSDQLLDTGILAGCALSSTFLGVNDEFTFKGVVEHVQTHKTGLAACQNWRDSPPIRVVNYGDVFMRARLAVKYSLILTVEGNCMPLPLAVPPQGTTVSLADVPADLEDIFSLRLPDEMYFYICKGMISAQLVGWLTSGYVIEPQPLADAPHYKRFVKDVLVEGNTAPRCVSLALLASVLHPQWMQRRVVCGIQGAR
jgi:hypothetical protein